MSADDELNRQSLLNLFREEAETQTRVLSNGLLTLESAPTDQAALEACMRAAHSLKGAARIIGLQDGVDIAHLMEESFVSAQRGALTLSAAHIDALLRGVDLLLRIGHEEHASSSLTRQDIDAFIACLQVPGEPDGALPDAAQALPKNDPPPSNRNVSLHDPNRMLRVHADNLDRLLSLSGESLVESRWLKPFTESMLRVKRTQRVAARGLDAIYDALAAQLDPQALAELNEVRQTLGTTQQLLGARIDELDRFDRRSTNLAQELYNEALQCRMRPFGDATHAYPRIVRDLARSLGKRVRFSIVGEATQVDRDILDMLDAPLGHLLRNALDHGVETPEQRVLRGKSAEANLTLEARHSAGKLLISVSDDGAGIDLDKLRTAIVKRRLADEETSLHLSDQELLEFLLLPGFSMREQVTELSGRGVGLDVVHEMVKAVRGTVRIINDAERGARFVLQLPLTLSIIRSLLVEVGGEAYAFPLAHVRRTLELARSEIDLLEGQQHFLFEGRPVGLVTAHQLLEAAPSDETRASIAAIVIGNERETYGIAVDRFLGERMLVVQPLDSRLGKIKDIAAGALMENGEVVLIIDVEDLLHSVDRLVRGGQLDKVRRAAGAVAPVRKHVLVIDDSLTVRELERKLLEKRGYAVTIAVDGMDGWSALRNGTFDLVVTDIDMPRMDGIELVALIKRDVLLRKVPVMIVSYKDREEDRRRGLDAGADYYLAKGNFHDEALFDAVRELIGDA